MHGPKNVKLDYLLFWNLRWIHRLETDNRQCTVSLLLAQLISELCCVMNNSDRF